MIQTLIHVLLANIATGGALALQIPNLPIPIAAILAQGATIPGLANFVTFLQTVSILVGICLVLYGAWQIHQGRLGEGVLSLVAGFLSCVTVPVIRLIAGWTGGSL
jgi:hypothetical protein